MNLSVFSPQGAMMCAAFFFAGIIDAVCGGGGLLTLPAFIAVGFPVHLVTGTNQCTIIAGSATSLIRFVHGKCVHWPTALPTVIPTMIGAFLGAKLNMLLPDAVLERVMLVLVPVVAVLLLLKRNFGAENHVDTLNMRQRMLRCLATGLLIGAYQGFYGAGSGTFFMLAFAVLLRLDLTTASGNTKVVAFVSALTSTLTYAFSGMVVWSFVLAAMVTNVLGSYIGAELAMKEGAKFIRPMFFGVLALLFARLSIQFFA